MIRPLDPGKWDSVARGAFGEPRDREAVPGAGRLGMALFILSLSILFAASLVGYLVVRLRAEAWPPPGAPSLPKGLWVSTLILLTSSITMHSARRAARRDDQRRIRRMMVATTALGVAFVLAQILNWLQLYGLDLTARSGLYGFTFYVLTSLHALHVVGGLVALTLVTRRAFAGAYGPAAHAGVQYCGMYWHFLDAVWLVMFGLMVVA
jgi:cytochrome c oxidase subunit 3